MVVSNSLEEGRIGGRGQSQVRQWKHTQGLHLLSLHQINVADTRIFFSDRMRRYTILSNILTANHCHSIFSSANYSSASRIICFSLIKREGLDNILVHGSIMSLWHCASVIVLIVTTPHSNSIVMNDSCKDTLVSKNTSSINHTDFYKKYW